MAAVNCELEPTHEDIKLIREWLHVMPHLVQDYDDDALRVLLIACKGSLQRFKEKFQKLNSFGFTYPHMFGHLDPLNELTQYYLDNAYLFLMPKKTDDDCFLLIATSKQTELDSNKYNVTQLARYIFMSFLMLLWENNLGASKFVLVYDFRNSRLAEMKTCTPTFLKEFTTFLRKLPIRFQAGHFINVPHFWQPMLNLVKSLLPEKLANRINIHSSMEELYEIIPKKLLPKEFGGDEGDLDTNHNFFRKKVENCRDRLILENNKMRQLDRLRPKLNDHGEFQGTFRKLEVD